jgi:hypothetical protein
VLGPFLAAQAPKLAAQITQARARLGKAERARTTSTRSSPRSI